MDGYNPRKKSRFARKKEEKEVKGTTSEVEDLFGGDYMAPIAAEPAKVVKKPSSPIISSKKKLQQMMAESLQQGLEAKIEEGNKGFKLMQKFGYKEGQGLGK